MKELFQNILEISLAMTPIILGLLILTPLLGKRYTARLRYVVWIVVAVRLLIPLNIPLQNILRRIFPTSNLLDQVDKNAVMEAIRGVLAISADGATTQQALHNGIGQATFALVNRLAIVRLAGFMMFSLYHAIAYFLTIRRLKRWSVAVRDPFMRKTFDDIKDKLSITNNVGLFKSSRISTPMLIGFFSPRVLLPNKEIGAPELANIINHELCHFRRHDLWYKLLLLLSNAVNWFNPIVYLMVRQSEMDMELACDNDILKNADVVIRKQYGLTILSFVGRTQATKTPLTTYFYGGKKQMKKRFSDIISTSKKKSGIAFLAVFVLLVVFCGTWVGNNVFAAAPNAEQQKQGQIDQINDKLETLKTLKESANNQDNNVEMAWPVPEFYTITEPYGERYGGADFHTGIDIAGEGIFGAPVIAAADGVVKLVNREYTQGLGYGIYLVIDHGDGISTLYGHLSEILVKEGDIVQKGQSIAEVGSTGFSTEPHLQFEVRQDGKTTDPTVYLMPSEEE